MRVQIDYSRKSPVVNYLAVDSNSSSHSAYADQTATGNFCFLMNPKLIPNKTETREHTFKILEKLSLQIKNFITIKSFTGACNSFLSGLINLYLFFNRQNSLDNNNVTVCKIYCVFPNLNLELKRINKITLSKSPLSKFLVNGKPDSNLNIIINQNDTKNGFLAMSSKHRLITLPNDDINLKEILFGIWIHLPEEKVHKHNVNDLLIEEIIQRNKTVIYEKCINFLLKSKKIEVINSPSPDEAIFLLVIFLCGIQLFYEVKIYPNDKEKYGNKTCEELSNYSNEWLIAKKKISFKETNEPVSTSMNLSTVDKISTMDNYLENKFMIDGGKSKDMKASSKINQNKHKNNNINSNCNFKDHLDEIFEEDNYFDYDFPLSRGCNNKKTSHKEKFMTNVNSNANKNVNNNFNNNLSNFANNQTPLKTTNVKDVKSNLNTIQTEDETLTVNSSQQTSQKSFPTNSRTISMIPVPFNELTPTPVANNLPFRKFHTIDHDEVYQNHKKYVSMNEIALNEIYQKATKPKNPPMPMNDYLNLKSNLNTNLNANLNTNSLKQQQGQSSNPPKLTTNIENAYEIIYDQAKSIQTLQDKINSLQKELEIVVTKLKHQEESSLNCSCNKKINKNLISTGTSTSEDLLYQSTSNPQSNNQLNDYYNRSNKSNSNSLQSVDRNAVHISSQRNRNDSSKMNNMQQTQDRYDNFLNENSINFPRQFLDIDSKQYDSNHKDKEDYFANNTVTNPSISNVSNMNLIEKNFKLMQNNQIITNNSLLELTKSINFNVEPIEEPYPKIKPKNFLSGHFIKPIQIPHIDTDLKSKAPVLFTPSNFDITSTSIDPPSYRYFLKVPSMIYTGKTNSSILVEDMNLNSNENVARKKSIDGFRANDMTINLPRIIFNESLESCEENEGEI